MYQYKNIFLDKETKKKKNLRGRFTFYFFNFSKYIEE